MSKWYGIDVSDNQGVIDWAQVKSAGCQFAILRSVRRSGKMDYQFVNNLLGCRTQGIPVAVYKYTYATSEAEARNEALQVVELLQAHALDCQVWWDVEDRDTLAGLGRDRLTGIVMAAKETIEAAGYNFGIYAGQYVVKENWFDWQVFADCPWWVARYPIDEEGFGLWDVPEHMPPDVPMQLTGWQWTSKGRISGVSGNVDMDIMYQDPGQALEVQTEMEYFENPRHYHNGSTPETVYSSTDAATKIGSLDPWEECECIGLYNGMACVVYNITGKTVKKTGWVKWLGGLQD